MLSHTPAPPQDPAQLQTRLAAVTALLEDRTNAFERLRVESHSLRAERDTANAEIDKLRPMIRQLLRPQFGRRSEALDWDQLQLGLEDVEQSPGLAAKTGDGTEALAVAPSSGARKSAQRHRGALPSHLPRSEVVVDIDDKSCPCCGGPLHVIGDDVAEMLDVVLAHTGSG
jgi:transposase